jgi:lipopolysaccharide biosynthesis glycosyltransferase
MALEPVGVPLNLVTAADEKYLPYLACHLLSLAERGTQEDRKIDVTVIHRGISPPEQGALETLVGRRLNVNWVEPQPDLLRRVGAPSEFASCSPHYFRLLTPFLLAAQERAVYLDADTIVVEDISPLQFTDLEGLTTAAVRDYLPCVSDAVDNWKELNLAPSAPYFNSGVLVMDLAEWRAQDIAQRVLRVCQENEDHLLAQRRWPQYDQYGLNVVLHGRWKALDPAWNHGTDMAPSPARIVHYIGNGKIGRPTCDPYFEALFFELLNRTPYRDWQPAKVSDAV